MMFPTEFERSHKLCLYIHDIMVEFIKSGEMHDVFSQSINITEEEGFSLEKTDQHILDWLEENNKSEQRNLVIRTVVLPAVLSDMLHCIFEGLSASKKVKWQFPLCYCENHYRKAYICLSQWRSTKTHL